MNITIIRRVLVVMIVVLLVSVVWLSYRAISATNNNQLTPTSGPILRNAFYPRANQNSIEYYNGDTFVSYNTKDASMKALTSVRGITDITNMYWVKEGVVFSVSSAAPWHPVGKQYEQYVSQHDGDSDPNGFSTDSVLNNFFWYLSFKDNAITLLSVGQDNPLLYATVTEDGGLLFREFPNYSLLQPDGTVQRAIALLPDENNERRVIKVTASEYVYLVEKDDNIAVFSHDFKSNTDKEILPKLYSNKDHSIYSEVAMKDDTIYYQQPNSDNETLSVHTLDIKTKKSEKLIDSFRGIIRVSSSGSITAVHNGNEYTKLYTLTDAANALTIAKPLAPPIYLLNAGEPHYATLGGYVYKVGGSEASPRPDIALEKKIFGDNDFALSRNIESTNDNSYTVIFITGSVNDRMNQVYKAVEAAGYNPLEFSFTANPGPRATY